MLNLKQNNCFRCQNQNKDAPQKVMKDIASSSEEMYKFFGGNTKEQKSS